MEFSPNNSIDTNLNKISKTFKSFPIVLKPYEGLGSKGVQIINNKIDLKKALHECVYFQKIHPSMGSKFLVQEYISGEEGFVNFYSFNGKHLVTDAWMYNKRLVNGHSLDFECVLTMKMSPALNNAISYCKKVLDAIGYK
jgi:biotin carboxylase